KRQISGFNDGSYRPVVKLKSSTPVSNLFSAFEEDNCNSMDDLVDDTRKKVEAPPKKTSIWSRRTAERNKAFSPKTELLYLIGIFWNLQTWIGWWRKQNMGMFLVNMVDGIYGLFGISYESM
ncbi:hypothetical protein Tco_0430847, partial [Tanacetum coccineum]